MNWAQKLGRPREISHGKSKNEDEQTPGPHSLHKSVIDPQVRFWNYKYLLLFLLWVFWMKTTVTRPSLLKSLTVKKYASSNSKWVADSRGDTSPKRKIKKFKILHERNYIKSTNGKCPKLWRIWKMGYLQTLSRKLKKWA